MATCKSCNTPIRWETTSTGRQTPVNLDGTPHWKTCPNVASFRRRRTRAQEARSRDAGGDWGDAS